MITFLSILFSAKKPFFKWAPHKFTRRRIFFFHRQCFIPGLRAILFTRESPPLFSSHFSTCSLPITLSMKFKVCLVTYGRSTAPSNSYSTVAIGSIYPQERKHMGTKQLADQSSLQNTRYIFLENGYPTHSKFRPME